MNLATPELVVSDTILAKPNIKIRVKVKEVKIVIL